MSELAFTALRLGYLLLLWMLVLSALMVIRHDIYGTLISKRGRGKNAKTGKAGRALSFKPAKTHKKPRGSSPDIPQVLVVTAGPLTGSTLQLAGVPIVIGRSPDSTLVLDDDYASAQHARIYAADNMWWVEDLQSTNGTLVAGHRIDVPTPLNVGLAVQIGTTSLELRG